jgi:hypothetical protein
VHEFEYERLSLGVLSVMSVMGIRESAIVGGSLLAMCCLIPGAAAFESDQTDLPSGSPPAFSLPAFLDSARLLNLQEAWRAQVKPTVVPPLPGFDASSADAPVTKSPKPEAREPAAVRQRAEELSRRFSSDGASAKAASTAKAPDPTPPPFALGAAPPPSSDRSGADLPADTPAPSHVGAALPVAAPVGTDTTTAALPDPSEKKQAPAKKHSGGKSARLNVGIPPLPVRAPRKATAAVQVRAPVVHHSRRVTSPMAPPRVENEHREVFPPYLGAPGWNAQRR